MGRRTRLDRFVKLRRDDPQVRPFDGNQLGTLARERDARSSAVLGIGVAPFEKAPIAGAADHLADAAW
jgi:hypothetical protein